VPAPLPAPPPAASSPAAPAQAVAAPAASAGDLASQRAALVSTIAAPDFPVRLREAAASLPPAEAILLLGELAPKLGDALESRRLLAEAAALALLLGDYGQAAALYQAAALRVPGQRDAKLLLQASRSWLAVGEGEKAGELAALILLSAEDTAAKPGARIVAAWSALLSGRMAEAIALAGAFLAENPALSAKPAALALRREARFIRWAAASGAERESLRAELEAEFPGSPEAMIAANAAGVELLPRPHWYLTALGLAPSPAIAVPATPAPAAAPATSLPAAAAPAAAAPASAGAAKPAGTPGAAAPSPEALRFQVGAYASAENAERLRKELEGKGFTVVVEKRSGKGGSLLTVIVEGGADSDATRLKLKDSGYEAFPL
jgi:cell division septation protein DedD